MNTRALITAIAAPIMLAGCSAQDQGENPVAANGTVAATVADLPEHRRLAVALSDTRLAPVLDGKGVYTLLAPNDAAFTALGDRGTTLGDAQHRPLMIAVLRAHLLPGEVTPDSIEKAIAREKGPVEMRTMAGGTVRFSKGERGIVVGNGESEAVLTGTARTASNGAVLPIDEVLLPGRD
jgi:uncharacterized surface protein with fasciclin (FAS1) repeats